MKKIIFLLIFIAPPYNLFSDLAETTFGANKISKIEEDAITIAYLNNLRAKGLKRGNDYRYDVENLNKEISDTLTIVNMLYELSDTFAHFNIARSCSAFSLLTDYKMVFNLKGELTQNKIRRIYTDNKKDSFGYSYYYDNRMYKKIKIKKEQYYMFTFSSMELDVNSDPRYSENTVDTIKISTKNYQQNGYYKLITSDSLLNYKVVDAIKHPYSPHLIFPNFRL